MKLRNTQYGLCISYCILFFLVGCTLPTPLPPPTAEQAPFILVTDVLNATPSSTPFSPLMTTALLTLTQTPTPTSPPTLLPTKFPLPKEAEIAVREISRPQYTLKAELDYDVHTLKVEETIIYTNRTGIPLDSLVLVVEQNRRKDCFALESVRINRFRVTPNLKGARLEIPLGASLQPNEAITLEIAYQLNIPPKRSDEVFGYLSYQINLVDWYPFVAPYTHRNGWVFHEPSGVGEHLVYDASDFDVLLKVEGEDDLVIAASAEGEVDDAWTRYQLKAARNFVFSVSPAHV